MCSLTQEDVLRILKIMDCFKTGDLRLEMDGLKLAIVRSGADPHVSAAVGGSDPVTPRVDPFQAPGAEKHAQLTALPGAAEESSTGEVEGLTPIRAQMLGTFYRAPKPGALPFVDVGQAVTEEDTICIIEVMKLFTTIKAGIRGRIAKVCVEDGQLVEFNQVLFLVQTEADEAPVLETRAQ